MKNSIFLLKNVFGFLKLISFASIKHRLEKLHIHFLSSKISPIDSVRGFTSSKKLKSVDIKISYVLEKKKKGGKFR